MYLKHNSLGDDIPIVIILKAMGLECDQEIVQLVGTEPEMVDMFSGSLEEPYNLGIYSQEQVWTGCEVYMCVLVCVCSEAIWVYCIYPSYFPLLLIGSDVHRPPCNSCEGIEQREFPHFLQEVHQPCLRSSGGAGQPGAQPRARAPVQLPRQDHLHHTHHPPRPAHCARTTLETSVWSWPAR